MGILFSYTTNFNDEMLSPTCVVGLARSVGDEQTDEQNHFHIHFHTRDDVHQSYSVCWQTRPWHRNHLITRELTLLKFVYRLEYLNKRIKSRLKCCTFILDRCNQTVFWILNKKDAMGIDLWYIRITVTGVDSRHPSCPWYHRVSIGAIIGQNYIPVSAQNSNISRDLWPIEPYGTHKYIIYSYRNAYFFQSHSLSYTSWPLARKFGEISVRGHVIKTSDN